MKGFIRQQEEKLAQRYLAWRYQRAGIPLPPPSDLKQRATLIVEDMPIGLPDKAAAMSRPSSRNWSTISKKGRSDF